MRFNALLLLSQPMVTIGQRIKQARQKLSLTQAELARRLDISRASVSIWESGGNVSQENVLKLTKILRVRPEWLQYGVEARPDVDVDLLTQCLDKARTAAGKSDVALNSDLEARLVACLYADASRGISITAPRVMDLLKILNK